MPPGPFFVSSALVVSVATLAAAQPRELAVPRTSHRPVIDGVLDDAAWAGAATLGQRVQTVPADFGWASLAGGDLGLPLRTVARGGIAKVSYLWRF